MKANNLREILKKMISEEVQKQLPKLLFELLGQTGKNVIKEANISSNNVNKQSIAKPVAVKPVAPKQIKQYVKDPVLNKILNETTPGLVQTTYNNTSVLDMVGGNFEKIGKNDEIYTSMKELVNEEVATISTVPEVNSVVESNPLAALSKVFNRDYRAVMKAIDDKKKNGVSGNMMVGMG